MGDGDWKFIGPEHAPIGLERTVDIASVVKAINIARPRELLPSAGSISWGPHSADYTFPRLRPKMKGRI